MPTVHMMPHLAAREDMRSVTLEFTYGDIIVKFQLPLTSGLDELKQEVKKRFELELDRFDVEYKDDEGDWVFLGCDEDLSNLLLRFDDQVIKLLVVEFDPRCRFLKRKRPFGY